MQFFAFFWPDVNTEMGEVIYMYLKHSPDYTVNIFSQLVGRSVDRSVGRPCIYVYMHICMHVCMYVCLGITAKPFDQKKLVSGLQVTR